jgi:hypothetical protein
VLHATRPTSESAILRLILNIFIVLRFLIDGVFAYGGQKNPCVFWLEKAAIIHSPDFTGPDAFSRGQRIRGRFLVLEHGNTITLRADQFFLETTTLLASLWVQDFEGRETEYVQAYDGHLMPDHFQLTSAQQASLAGWVGLPIEATLTIVGSQTREQMHYEGESIYRAYIEWFAPSYLEDPTPTEVNAALEGERVLLTGTVDSMEDDNGKFWMGANAVIAQRDFRTIWFNTTRTGKLEISPPRPTRVRVAVGDKVQLLTYVHRNKLVLDDFDFRYIGTPKPEAMAQESTQTAQLAEFQKAIGGGNWADARAAYSRLIRLSPSRSSWKSLDSGLERMPTAQRPIRLRKSLHDAAAIFGGSGIDVLAMTKSEFENLLLEFARGELPYRNGDRFTSFHYLPRMYLFEGGRTFTEEAFCRHFMRLWISSRLDFAETREPQIPAGSNVLFQTAPNMDLQSDLVSAIHFLPNIVSTEEDVDFLIEIARRLSAVQTRSTQMLPVGIDGAFVRVISRFGKEHSGWKAKLQAQIPHLIERFPETRDALHRMLSR